MALINIIAGSKDEEYRTMSSIHDARMVLPGVMYTYFDESMIFLSRTCLHTDPTRASSASNLSVPFGDLTLGSTAMAISWANAPELRPVKRFKASPLFRPKRE